MQRFHRTPNAACSDHTSSATLLFIALVAQSKRNHGEGKPLQRLCSSQSDAGLDDLSQRSIQMLRLVEKHKLANLRLECYTSSSLGLPDDGPEAAEIHSGKSQHPTSS
eukprot:4842102-Amphidinium_carterae.1